MTVFELESALVEFVAQNTSEFRFQSNEQSEETTCPAVWSGFIPRDEVGSIIPGDITVYPAVIVNAQSGTQASKGEGELVTVSIVIGCYDANLDQQGYRDCCNVLQRLKDRFREIDIIREAFPLRYPLNWQMNKKYGSSGSPAINAYPYFFAEMQLIFELTGMTSQFDLGAWDGDVTPGRYNTVPIPTPPPLEHAKHPTEPPIKWVEKFEVPAGGMIKD